MLLYLECRYVSQYRILKKYSTRLCTSDYITLNGFNLSNFGKPKLHKQTYPMKQLKKVFLFSWLIVATVVGCFQQSKAQSTAPKPDRQKHEFALDVQDVFNGFLYRHNLIYKRRLEGKKTVRLDQTSRLRLQLGLRGQVSISDTSHVGATNYFRATPQLNPITLVLTNIIN